MGQVNIYTHHIHTMTRVQILLDKNEIRALRHMARYTGKGYSQLVREAIENTYISRFSNEEIARMAKEARQGKGIKTFKSSQSFLRYLWSL